MRRMFGVVLAVLLGAALSAPGASAETPKLRIGAHRAVMGSFEVIAHKMGYWKEVGLDYTFQYFKQGKLMRNAVIQNNLDTGTTGFSPFTTAISKGAKVVAIGVTADLCATTGVVVPVKSKVKSVKELRGQTIAVKKGTSVDFAFKSYVLPANGLKVKDLKWLSVNTTDVVAALVSGSAQGGIVGDPQKEIAIQKGLIREIENFCPYDRPRMMHIGNPQTVKEHPELYVKYFKGWLKAHELLKKDPEKYAQVYTQALQEVGDKADYKIILPVVKRLRSQLFIDKEVRTYLNDMGDKQVKLGWIKGHPDFTMLKNLDDSILRKVAKEMNYN